jgi:hypothetical protein
MELRILCKSNAQLIVTVEDTRKLKLIENKVWSQRSSFVAVAAAIYSASVIDKVTTGCFLLCHDIKAP